MRKTIVRTITATTIKSVILKFVDGKAELKDNEDLILNGKVTEEKALKEVRKIYGEMSQLKSVEETTNTYEISVDDFIKHAKIVENSQGEDEKEEKAV